MHKYRIMLVDTADAREETMCCIDWDALGCEIVAGADTGAEALAQAETAKPDIVLVDASLMPECSPLFRAPGIKLIATSSESSFVYAKDAIRFGAIGYILKPIDTDELTSTLLRARRLSAESFEQKRTLDMFRDKSEKSLPAMREHFLNELIWGAVPHDEIPRQIKLYNLSIDQGAYKMVIVFEIDPEEIYTEPKPASIIRIINEQLGRRCKAAAFMGTLEIVAITSWENPEPISEVIGVANQICSKCMNTLELKLTAGIGGFYDSAGNIYESFLDAKFALEHKAGARAVYIEDVRHDRLGSPNDPYNGERIFSAVKFGSRDQIVMHIRDMLDEMAGFEDWKQQARIFGLLNEVYQIIERYELYNETRVMEVLELYVKAPDADVNEWFMELCICMSEHIRFRRERAPHSLSEEAKRFIDSHYHENGLSVERLCEYLHVSQSYFSTVFKQETGMSYVHYLTELRMSRAVALLQQTDDKTYIIASRVGYDDPNYFSYVFKKRFGVSPAKYRKFAKDL